MGHPCPDLPREMHKTVPLRQKALAEWEEKMEGSHRKLGKKERIIGDQVCGVMIYLRHEGCTIRLKVGLSLTFNPLAYNLKIASCNLDMI